MTTAIITGGSSGLGKEYANQLAQKGHNIILVARRENLLKKTCKELESRHKINAKYITAELSEEKEIQKVIKTINKTDNIEFLINNAGFTTLDNFYDEKIETQEQMAKVHVLATMKLTHAMLQKMIKKNQGTIINVSSIAGFLIGPGSTTYCSTKAFVKNFTESLALELKNTKIKMQVICPGFTLTDFHKKLGYDTSKKKFKKFMTSEEVVKYSLDSLKKNKILCVPKLKYKILSLFPKLLPRKIFYKLMLTHFKAKKNKNKKN